MGALGHRLILGGSGGRRLTSILLEWSRLQNIAAVVDLDHIQLYAQSLYSS